MSMNLGFWTSFAAWLPIRFRDLPGSLKDDFVLDLIALFQTLGPIVDHFPRRITLANVWKYVFVWKDPLAPVRDGIRAFQTKWSA